MSDIGRVRKYEVYLAERQKRDLGGGVENQEEEEDYKEQKDEKYPGGYKA